jgi:hypothetical protein
MDVLAGYPVQTDVAWAPNGCIERLQGVSMKPMPQRLKTKTVQAKANWSEDRPPGGQSPSGL